MRSFFKEKLGECLTELFGYLYTHTHTHARARARTYVRTHAHTHTHKETSKLLNYCVSLSTYVELFNPFKNNFV
jgi:hypothetical protein